MGETINTDGIMGKGLRDLRSGISTMKDVFRVLNIVIVSLTTYGNIKVDLKEGITNG